MSRDGRDGKRGLKGLPGDRGPMPLHEWDGTKIRFQKGLKSWGDWIELKGADGESVDPEILFSLIREEVGKIPHPEKGDPGEPGKDIDPKIVLKFIEKEVGKIPVAKDGDPGPRGPRGFKGEKGDDGKSAYEIWLELGHKGTKEDFLEWLIRHVFEEYKKSGPFSNGRGVGGGGIGGNFRLEGGFGFNLTGAGNVLTTGVKGFIPVPYDMKIREWVLLGDPAITGSAVVDIWLSNYDGAFPEEDDSITGTTPPTIDASNKGKSLDVSGWDVKLKKGDVMVFNIKSVSNFRNLTLALNGIRS